jgi:hypothetical protein
MRNLLRQPLSWMVIAECIVITVLLVVVWSVITAAATQQAGSAPIQALEAPTKTSAVPLPDLTKVTRLGPRALLPGLNLDSTFWRMRLGQLNQEQVLFEQLEWRIVHSAKDALQRYLETVVVPSVLRAEAAR